jgi:hypothetical protein
MLSMILGTLRGFQTSRDGLGAAKPPLPHARLGLLILGGMLAFVVGQSCGDVTDSRVEARNKATNATCARYDQCMLIGPGLVYETIDSCKVDWLAGWEGAWPPADCQGRIDQGELAQCLNAIAATECNIGDLALTLLKCTKADICGAVRDASAGG